MRNRLRCGCDSPGAVRTTKSRCGSRCCAPRGINPFERSRFPCHARRPSAARRYPTPSSFYVTHYRARMRCRPQAVIRLGVRHVPDGPRETFHRDIPSLNYDVWVLLSGSDKLRSHSAFQRDDLAATLRGDVTLQAYNYNQTPHSRRAHCLNRGQADGVLKGGLREKGLHSVVLRSLCVHRFDWPTVQCLSASAYVLSFLTRAVLSSSTTGVGFIERVPRCSSILSERRAVRRRRVPPSPVLTAIRPSRSTGLATHIRCTTCSTREPTRSNIWQKCRCGTSSTMRWHAYLTRKAHNYRRTRLR